MSDTIYRVFRDKHTRNNRAHLSRDGVKALCGVRVANQGWQFGEDQSATAQQFIDLARDRCRHCLSSARVMLKLTALMEKRELSN